jgi:hypothetical protein
MRHKLPEFFNNFPSFRMIEESWAILPLLSSSIKSKNEFMAELILLSSTQIRIYAMKVQFLLCVVDSSIIKEIST